MTEKHYRVISVLAFAYFVITMVGRFGTYSDGIDAAIIFCFVWMLGYESRKKE